MSQTENSELKDDIEALKQKNDVHEKPPLETIEEGEMQSSQESSSVTEAADSSEVSEVKGTISAFIESFMKELELLPDVEAKLHHAVKVMEEVLSQNKAPSFKDFWQARDVALKLFKEHINPSVRTTLWSKYSELSKEARRLKDLLDEQSSFAAEQIDIAIKALEADLELLSEIKNQPIVEDPYSLTSQTLAKNVNLYIQIQRELDLLNSHASRINALRKELIRTEMRVRKKNQFFQRLSSAGDKVFPQRKALIQQISKQFMADIEGFIATYFSQSTPNAPSFFLRDEIKNLQNIAKVLTLNSPAFAQTRMRLSECWDKVKELDKERKKERAQQKSIFKQNADEISQKLDVIVSEMQAGTISTDEASDKLHAVSKQMREVELGKDEVKWLRDRLEEVRKPILDQIKNEKQLREDQEKDRVRQKQQKIIDFKQEIETFLQNAKDLEADEIVAEKELFLAKIQTTALNKSEKQDLERKLKSLRDLIAEKKEQALMNLPEGDRQQLQQLRELLKQRQERRQEIKDQIESLRRVAGSSNLDFMRAMECNSQLKEEKERLEKINLGIEEIEEKISDLEG